MAGEAFGAMREIRLFRRAHFFVRRFESASREYCGAIASHQTAVQMPRFVLEVVLFGGMIALMLWIELTRKTATGAVPTAALFALAGYRLMPILQQSFAGLADAKFNAGLLAAVSRDLASPTTSQTPSAPSGAPIQILRHIELWNVVFRHVSDQPPTLEVPHLLIPGNRTVVLSGPSGSGKSTLVDLILGLLRPEAGGLYVDGSLIDDVRIPVWQAAVGLVPQHAFFLDDTIQRNVAFGVPDAEIDAESVRGALADAQLLAFVDGLSEGVESNVGEHGSRLSGGQRQRLAIARALYANPAVLVFDEATSALDAESASAVWKSIQSLAHRKTILIVSHDPEAAALADVVYYVHEGRISDQAWIVDETQDPGAGGEAIMPR